MFLSLLQLYTHVYCTSMHTTHDKVHHVSSLKSNFWCSVFFHQISAPFNIISYIHTYWLQAKYHWLNQLLFGTLHTSQHIYYDGFLVSYSFHLFIQCRTILPPLPPPLSSSHHITYQSTDNNTFQPVKSVATVYFRGFYFCCCCYFFFCFCLFILIMEKNVLCNF